MTRPNVPSRVCAVLACVAPLTPKQLALALDYPSDRMGVQLSEMCRAGRLQRVGLTARQRRLSYGRGSAYALVRR